MGTFYHGHNLDILRGYPHDCTAHLAYIAMSAPPQVELRRVLRPTRSLNRHCDPTASNPFAGAPNQTN